MQLHAAELRQAWLDLHESWLTAKAAEIGITDASGFAIVGIGGLGRRELLPYSDLDLMLLHDNKSDGVLQRVADELWYPLWDANVRLDHSVRTVSGALGVANSDMIAALGMLDARHIAGRRAAVRRIDRRRKKAVAQRNSFSDGRACRNNRCPLAALWPDRATRRAGPEIGSRRSA